MSSENRRPPKGIGIIERLNGNRPFYEVYADLYAKGKNDSEIAIELCMTPKTLREYKRRVGLETVLRLPSGEIVEQHL